MAYIALAVALIYVIGGLQITLKTTITLSASVQMLGRLVPWLAVMENRVLMMLKSRSECHSYDNSCSFLRELPDIASGDTPAHHREAPVCLS